MPEMSALIVNEPSILNDSAQFCLEEIFKSSKKKNLNNDMADKLMLQKKNTHENFDLTDQKKGISNENTNLILSELNNKKSYPTK